MGLALGMEALEVVFSQLGIEGAVFQQVIEDYENRMTNRQQRALLPPSAHAMAKLGCQVGVSAAGGGPSGLKQRGAQPAEKTPDLIALLHNLLEYDTAGDPLTDLRWSRRTTVRIAEELANLGLSISPNTVARLLHQMGHSLRVNRKLISTHSRPHRNRQFEYLAELRDRFQRRHWPIISVNTKKRELVGNFSNPGRCGDRAPRPVFDHDFRTDSIGVAIPYGISDLTHNRGTLVVGVSHDTPAFAAPAIAWLWRQEAASRYSGSRPMLILADTGGRNACRCWAWKSELQSQVANPFSLAVTVAHYPTGTSKWNPVEHRLFSEISRNWAGEPLDSYQRILNYAPTTRTQTRLAVTAYLDRRYYPCCLKPSPEQVASLRLKRHEVLPEWNYTISPQL